MNVAGTADLENPKVLSLFGRTATLESDPMEELLENALMEESEELLEAAPRARLLVSQTQFPDQALFTLDQQLADLRQNLGRLKFYLGDLEDLLPR